MLIAFSSVQAELVEALSFFATLKRKEGASARSHESSTFVGCPTGSAQTEEESLRMPVLGI
jgi:hypothetical protein